MNVILGAGMAGMGAFYRDNSFEVFEKEDQAGGLCGRFSVKSDDGRAFYFDKAVHLSFTENPVVKEAFAKAAQNIYNPVPHSWFKNMWVQHPAQNNLYPMAVEFKVKALKDFINRNQSDNPNNFKQWLLFQYGKYLYDELFEPYNKKYWCTDLEQMDTCWVGNRFYRPNIEEVLYGSYTDKTPNTYYAKEMRYPKKGGYLGYIGSLIGGAENAGKMHYGYEAESIDLSDKTISFTNGKRIKYGMLLSSVPLPTLLKCMKDAPADVRNGAESLEYTSIALVSFGFKRVIKCKDIWFYIYDTDILAARAYLPSLKSSDNVPENCSSIQFEIYRSNKGGPFNSEKCIRNCIYALKKMGLADESDIIARNFRTVEYGNIIFRKDTRKKANDIINWLESNGIYPIGRFGRWDYLWSDQSFLSGYEMAKIN